MENMRSYLATLNSSEPLFVGHKFPTEQDAWFLSGGAGNKVHSLIENKVNKNVLFLAGYVLTRESIRRLVEHGLDQNLCPTEYPGVKDDVTISMFPETILDNLYLKSWVF